MAPKMTPKIEGINYRKINKTIQESESEYVLLTVVDKFINHNTEKLLLAGKNTSEIRKLWKDWICWLG